jgi:tetratricopeptide (TPR) repeat protein
MLSAHGYMPMSEARPRAEAAASRALQLDPSLVETNFTGGLVASVFGVRLADAENQFHRTIMIQAHSPLAHAFLGLVLAATHRREEAVGAAHRAIELDPESAFIHGVAALALQCARAHEEAHRVALRTLELQPDFVHGLWARNMAACSLGKFGEAIEVGESLLAVSRRSSVFVGQQALTYGFAGQREKAIALRREMLQRMTEGEYVGPTSVLAVALGLDDLEQGRAALSTYLQEGGNGWHLEISLGPFLDRLAHASALKDLFDKLGRPPMPAQ